MSAFKAIRASNQTAVSALKGTPVAVFVGGTSGIGQGMAEVFGRLTNGNAHIVIVGRNGQAAESILASLPKPTSSTTTTDKQWSHEFVECDATLIKNVRKASQEILQRHPKINFLALSLGIMTSGGRDDTVEGLDKKMAVHYYSRWKFIQELLPALNKAKEEGEDAKVMSVLAPGVGGEVNLDDLGLVETYSLTTSALAAPTYNDLMLEEFSAHNPGLTFIHAHPGVVKTGITSNSPSIAIRTLGWLAMTFFGPFMATREVCGEWMWHAIFQYGPGVFRTGRHGEDLKRSRYFGNETQRKKLWEHTVEVTSVSDA